MGNGVLQWWWCSGFCWFVVVLCGCIDLYCWWMMKKNVVRLKKIVVLFLPLLKLPFSKINPLLFFFFFEWQVLSLFIGEMRLGAQVWVWLLFEAWEPSHTLLDASYHVTSSWWCHFDDITLMMSPYFKFLLFFFFLWIFLEKIKYDGKQLTKLTFIFFCEFWDLFVKENFQIEIKKLIIIIIIE